MTAGVLLRYAGGEVYALPRHVVGLVWDLAVAGVVLRCRLDASTIPDGAWLRVPVDLATLAAMRGIERRVGVMTAARVAAEAAEHERVALEMERAPTKAKRTGKGRAKR